MKKIDIVTKLSEKGDRYQMMTELLNYFQVPFVTQEKDVSDYRTVQNIIVHPEALERQNPRLITAHYDRAFRHAFFVPGANDNASSVAILINIIKEVAHPDICFTFFDKEEMLSHNWEYTGSYNFIDQLSREQRDHLKALNLDSCGIGDTLLIDESPIHPRNVFPNQLHQSINQAYIVGFYDSDHSVFIQRGFNAATLTVLPEDEYKGLLNKKAGKTFIRMHTNLDTPDSVQPETMDMVQEVLLNYINNV